ncbi:MAG TPA: hypothetical protein VKU62_04830 [Thermoanaerobaculia bacterium]|nr:hypothetical protein [Thermoanaerobaculia bacterium]
MPKQKDLKRIVRSRMQKTGESYTAARLQVLKKKDADFAALAGMSDAAVRKATGHHWADWVKALDGAGAMSKTHREIVKIVNAGDWWSQMVTVGYERIRGLRDKGQRRGGGYEAGKSKTFNVPVARLFDAFRKSLPSDVSVKSATPNKRMRIAWHDGTTVEAMFLSKSAQKSSVAVTHQKLADKSAADKMKAWWGERLAKLVETIA